MNRSTKRPANTLPRARALGCVALGAALMGSAWIAVAATRTPLAPDWRDEAAAALFERVDLTEGRPAQGSQAAISELGAMPVTPVR